MTNYFYSEEFQEIPKSKKTHVIKPNPIKPSMMSLKFILGYGAALSVIKLESIGNLKILLN